MSWPREGHWVRCGLEPDHEGVCLSNEKDQKPCPSCDRDLSYPGAPGHECYTYAEQGGAR